MENRELPKIKENLKKLRSNLENFYDKFIPLEVVKHINDLFIHDQEEAEKWVTTFNSFKDTGMTFLYLEKIIEDYEKAENYTEFQYAMFNEWIINNTYSFLLSIAIELKFFEMIYKESKKINTKSLDKILETKLDYFKKFYYLSFHGFYEAYIIKLKFARNVLNHPLNVYKHNFKEIFPHIKKPVPISVDRVSASVRYIGYPENYRENYSILFSIVQPTSTSSKNRVKINIFELLSQILVFMNGVIKDFYSNFTIN